MNELIEWFEDRYDPDTLVDVLGLTTEDIVRAFEDKAREYQLSSESEEEAAFEEGL